LEREAENNLTSSPDGPAGPSEEWLKRLRRDLNPPQLEFATTQAGAILGLAGPGSGKTRALVYRCAHLLQSVASPDELLLLTFTNKAAEEMKERLKKLLGAWPRDLWAGTFHSTGARILRHHAALVRRSGNFTILDEDDSRAMFKHIINAYSPRLGEEERNVLLKRGLLGRVITQARNSDLAIREVMLEHYPYRLDYLELIEELAGRYAQKKEESNALDFDDLLICWLELFERHPDVRDRYCARFKHVLVDEYQDTNAIQGRIVDLFAGESSLCVVGDDAQSIYAFRFASVRNILSFPEKYPHSLVVRMERNYRSTPEIVALADCSISFNREQLPKKLFSQNPSGAKPRIAGARSASDEASYVIRRITELRRDGVPLHEIAVLYRSAYLSAALELALVNRGIPYRMYGGLKFFQKAHIKDVLAFLRVFYNPFDESAWRRIATLQPGIGDSSFDRLWLQLKERGNPLEAALAGDLAPPRGKEGWQSLCRMLQAARAVEGSVPQMIDSIVTAGYTQTLAKNYPDQYEERLRGIQELARYAIRFNSLPAFLESLALEESLFAGATADALPETNGDHLVLSTIHSAKGKEWEAVFVIALNDGHFPRRDDTRNLPEERRLFYVAATRARRFLYLTTYRDEYRAWAAPTGRPSQFLTELSPEYYEAELADVYDY
jgi:DNA helicase II / ATP-dependent DNA helicase PcrA